MSSQPPPDVIPVDLEDDDDPEVQALQAALVAKKAAAKERKRAEREKAEKEKAEKEKAEAEARKREEEARKRAEAQGPTGSNAGTPQRKGKRKEPPAVAYTVLATIPCFKCRKSGQACLFPEDVGQKSACGECVRSKVRCDGAEAPNVPKRARKARGKAKRAAEGPEPLPVPSGSGMRSEADQKAADVEMSRRDPLWPSDARMSNTELLYACLVEMQAMRREMAGLRADIGELQRRRETDISRYFGKMLKELREEFEVEETESEAEYSGSGSESRSGSGEEESGEDGEEEE
ncbi:hypothetical protein BV20DRAFT_984016 [Pilatotrama ljubarskyi]|nr:hypothetical protein BV20DRAFT_984016 [Pilatotrama ljubarskyi]